MLKSKSAITVGAPDDTYEQEADRIADHVVAIPDSQIAGASDDDSGNDGHPVQKKHVGGYQRPGAESGTKGNGTFSDSDRAFFESRFGCDFSRVRIHTDPEAVNMSRSLGAQAFTQGSDIYFNQGMYDSRSREGRKLIAHELTHVIQQTGGNAWQNKSLQAKIGTVPGNNLVQRAIQNVQPAELATFFSQPEPLLPQPILNKYLIEPSLMATQRAVIQDLVRHVQRANAPLSANGLIGLVMRRESNRGTALIICHNVTKALARGQSPINWSNVSRYPAPLVYSLNGTIFTFDPNQFHQDALTTGARGQESVFYAMLSYQDFGDRDEGDWYHYFSTRATMYYQASGHLQPDNPSQQDPTTRFVGSLVQTVANALRDSSVTSTRAYEGWLRANAISFLEGGHYGQNQGDVNAESDVHINGACDVLTVMGRIPEDNWEWLIPVAGSISLSDLRNFSLRNTMISRTRTGVVGNFELTIISGSTPDHWYDTPDPFVSQPGLFGRSTTTKVDTPRPVWNEVLDTYSYTGLTSVTLEFHDSDPISNDLIETFHVDLRTHGHRERRFSPTINGSTLRLRVRALGRVVIGTP